MKMDNNRENTTGTAPEQQGKTFTQEQVNAIVSRRLAEQKATQEADSVRREQELNKREMVLRAKELLSERGLSQSLADVLRYETEEELVKAIDTIEHVKGFKKEEGTADGGPEKNRIQENRLPEGMGYNAPDLIAEAFKLKG